MIQPAQLLAVSTALAFCGGSATASSGDAWDEFRADVARMCREAAGASEDILIEVDPFGSENFGLAMVYAASGRRICVYDKQTHEVEIGAGLISVNESDPE